MLFNELPDTFENYCIAIESKDQIPGINFIRGKLLEEVARRRNNDDQHGSPTARVRLYRKMHAKKS